MSNKIEKIMAMLKEDGESSFLLHALALEYVKLGNDQAAEKTFRQLLQTDPDYVGSYYHLGKLYERANDEVKAKQAYQTGMEKARKANDQHSLNELRSAFEYLDF